MSKCKQQPNMLIHKYTFSKNIRYQNNYQTIFMDNLDLSDIVGKKKDSSVEEIQLVNVQEEAKLKTQQEIKTMKTHYQYCQKYLEKLKLRNIKMDFTVTNFDDKKKNLIKYKRQYNVHQEFMQQ